MTQHTNRLIHEIEPVPAPARAQPGRLVSVGRRGAGRRRAAENKPILLSIGYSACHWCHVMEHESFEDEPIAQLMNEHFVNIKVDREERPDLDQIYMNAVQMLTGRGGWPMTVFLTPDGKPFYGGTYFPPEDRHGMPGFRRVLLARRAGVPRAKPTTCSKTVGQLMDGAAAHRIARRRRASRLAPDVGRRRRGHAGARVRCGRTAASARRRSFPTTRSSSCSSAPIAAPASGRYLDMVLHTLRQHGARAASTISSAAASTATRSTRTGWCRTSRRCSTTTRSSCRCYLAAYQAHRRRVLRPHRARDARLRRCARCATPKAASTRRRTPTAKARRASSSSGTRDEVRRASSATSAAEIVCRYWDVSEAGNFEDHNILHVTLEVEQLAKLFRRDADEVRALLADARAKLFAAREQRDQAGPRRQDPHGLERPDDQRLRQSRRGARRAALSRRSRSTPSPSSRRSCSAAIACSARTRTASPSSTATSTTTPSSSRRCSTSSRRCRIAATSSAP